MKSDCNVTLSTNEQGKAWVSSDLDIHGVQYGVRNLDA